jgi:hypothetical protein
MAIRARLYIDFDWVPDGSGMATLGQNQSNNPGYGAALGPGAVGNAQTLRLQVGEGVVPGGDTPTSGNMATMLTQAATDIGTLLSTPGAYSGGTQTPLSIIDGWATGNP